MALVRVEFTREHSDGLRSSSVYINGERLNFENDKAAKELPAGEEFEIYWRIFGNPNSTLTVKYTVEGVTKTVIDKSKIPANRNRKSDFTFIKL